MHKAIGMAVLPVSVLGPVLGACTTSGAAPEPAEYIAAKVKQVSESVFAVGVEAKNADEYAFIRCVAADYARYQEAESFAELPGGAPLHTRFLAVDGKRVTHSYGVRRFTTETTGEDAPPTILSVRDTLAACKKNGIPTGVAGEIVPAPPKAAAKGTG